MAKWLEKQINHTLPKASIQFSQWIERQLTDNLASTTALCISVGIIAGYKIL